MRDMDLLPPWYRRLVHQRRALVYQVGAAVLLAVVIYEGRQNSREQLRAADQVLIKTTAALDQKRVELQKKDAFDQLLNQLRHQEQALTATGVNLEASRLLAGLSAVIPPDTALTGLTLALVDRDDAAALPVATTMPALPEAAPVSTSPQRRLNVTLRGVAPGELAVGNILAGISKTPLFQHVNLTYAKDKQDPAGLVREFEVTFVINLSSAPVEQAK